MSENVKRQSKDSVFVSLFSDVNYVLELYRELHPEDTDVTADDINIQTITSVLVNTLYNDLGFLVKNRLVMLVEAQSVWNPNIALRMLFYLSETYKRYLSDTRQSVHSTSKVTLPRPELYVIYSGEKTIPRKISLAKDFFDGSSAFDIKVKILDRETALTISGQYIGFCKAFDEQRKIYADSIQCVTETIRICKEKGYLIPYFKIHEKEAITMMCELFDEEYLRKKYDEAEKRKNIDIGVAIGMDKGRAEEKARAQKILADRLRKKGMSEEQISELTSF